MSQKKNHEEKYLNELAEHLRRLYWDDEVRMFLESILTPQELVEISKRLQIVKQLKQGVSQRDIAENLGVGIATVTRGSREIKKGRFTSVKV